MTQILGISGSLRKASYNTALLRAASALVPDGISIQIFDLNPLPLYNDDLAKDGIPAPVNDFRNSIKQSNGLLIASPEYNYSLTGVLKNAIDWASTDTLGNLLIGKPTAIMGASPAYLAPHGANCTCGRYCMLRTPTSSSVQKLPFGAHKL